MKRTIILQLTLAIFCATGFALDQSPCRSECVDTETEMRESGIGRGETILEATLGAVSNALGRVKKRIEQTYPDSEFTYIATATSSPDGEQIEVETTLGQPNIICNEIHTLAEDSIVVYIALSIDISTFNQ